MRKINKILAGGAIAIAFLINSIGVQANTGNYEVKENDTLKLELEFNVDREVIESATFFEGIIDYDDTIYKELEYANVTIGDGLAELSYEDNHFIVKQVDTMDLVITVELEVVEGVKSHEHAVTFKNMAFNDGEDVVTIENVEFGITVLENQTNEVIQGEIVTASSKVDASIEEKTIFDDAFKMILMVCLLVFVGILLAMLCKKNKKGIIVTVLLILVNVLVIVGINLMEINNTETTSVKEVVELKKELHRLSKNVDVKLASTEDLDDSEELDSSYGSANNTGSNSGSNTEADTEADIEADTEADIEADTEADNETTNDVDSNGGGTDDKNDESDLGDLGNEQDELDQDELKNLSLNPMVENFYYTKGGDLLIEFYPTNTASYKLEMVTIEGADYTTVYNSDTCNYEVVVKVDTTSGESQINITGAKFSNGKDYELTESVEIEILKDVPLLGDIVVSENYETNEITIEFTLTDVDDAVFSSCSNIMDGEQVVRSVNIENGLNTITFDADLNIEYFVDLSVLYDLDLDQDNNINNDTVFASQYITMEDELQFELLSTKVVDENQEEIEYAENNQDFYLMLEVAVFSNYVPVEFVINGEVKNVYEVLEQDDLTKNRTSDDYNIIFYLIKYTAQDNQFGLHTFEVSEIVTNYKGFVIPVDNTEVNFAQVEIIKRKPVVSATLEEKQEILSVDYQLKDLDNSVSSLKVIVKNEQGDVYKELDVELNDKTEISGNLEISIENDFSKKFIVEIIADYDLGLGDVTNEVIFSKEYDAVIKTLVTNFTADKDQVKKDDTVRFKFEIFTNADKDVKSVVIADKIVDIEKDGDKYTAVVVLSETDAGILEFSITKIIFEDDSKSNATATSVELEVYKDLPVLANKILIEDEYALTVTVEFDIEDTDEAFINGNLEVYEGSNTADVTYYPITVGHNSIEIEVIDGAKYSGSIIISSQEDIAGTILNEDVIAMEFEFGILSDYKLSIEDMVIVDTQSNETLYLEKESAYKLAFKITTESQFVPTTVTLNGVEHSINESEEDVYYIELGTGEESGVFTHEISQVILSNEKGLDTESSIQYEVLKSHPEIGSLSYDVLDSGDIRVYLNPSNQDAIISYDITVNDGKADIYTKDSIDANTEYVDVAPSTSELYEITISAKYDLDTNTLSLGDNEYAVQLVNKIISYSQTAIEIKDIKSVTMYKDTNGATTILTEVDVEELNTENYFVQVVDGAGNKRYSEIESFEMKNGNLLLTLEMEDSVSYTDGRQNKTVVNYGAVVEGTAKNIDWATILELIAKDPTAEISLTHDLDANDIKVTTGTMIGGTFSGKFNGNGFTISNLKKPLFNSLDGAVVENIVINNANITDNLAILTITTNNINTITNVHIRNSLISRSASIGTFIALMNEGSDVRIERSSVSNTSISGGKRTGGMIGTQFGELVMNDVFVHGNVESSSDSSGGVIGGVYGNINLNNLYVEVMLEHSANTLRAGIVGFTNVEGGIITNTISLADGLNSADGWSFFSAGKSYDLTNNYQMSESNLSRSSGSGLVTMSREDMTVEFLVDTLGWSEDIWNMAGITKAGEMPDLKGVVVAEVGESGPSNDSLYIPNYSYVSELEAYDAANELSYHNMNVLMPYLDSKLTILYGNQMVDASNVLAEKLIDKIYPLNNEGNLVIGVNNDTKDTITKLRILFEDGEIQEFAVTYELMLDSVTVYIMDELGIKYNYAQLVFNSEASLYEEILDIVKTLDYMEDISIVTEEEEDRLFKDYYEQFYFPKIEEKVENIFESMSEFTLTNDSVIIKNKIKNDLLSDKTLEEILYTANYFDRYYNFDIGIAEDFSDVLFFDSNLYSDSKATALSIVSDTMSASSTTRLKNYATTFYSSIIAPKYSSQNIQTFLERHIAILDLNDNPDKWFADQFGGTLVEVKLDAENMQHLDYTAWHHINTRSQLLLAFLSAPEQAQAETYIVTCPTQISYGSFNRYSGFHSAGGQEYMENLINVFAAKVKNFYEVSASFTPDAEINLNNFVNIQYDTKWNYPATAPTPGTQTNGETEDPSWKWINDTNNISMASNGSSAYANGTDVYWVATAMIQSDYTFRIWTHESAHNQDGRLFFAGNGRRTGTGAEEFADGSIAQDIGAVAFPSNMRYDVPTNTDYATNLKVNRLMGADNYKSFYEGMFDSIYLLDYLEAQAFLRLTPAEQSILAAQVKYSNTAGEIYEEGNSGTNITAVKKITESEFADMELSSMEDLWDNQILMIGAGNYVMNTYGVASTSSVLWYHPHNNERVADGVTFKRTGYEAISIGGAQARVIHQSGLSSNDLDAIQKITGDDTMTWKKYKLGRFEEVENNLEKMPHFDTEVVIDMFEAALKTDAFAGSLGHSGTANTLRVLLSGIIKRNTQDYDNGSGIYVQNYQHEVSSSAELISLVNENEWGSYILTGDLDFSEVSLGEGMNYYISNRFTGLLDGNGYSIKNLSGALFNTTEFCNFKNITFDNVIILTDSKGIIANTALNTLTEDLDVINANATLKLYGTYSGKNYEINPTSYEVSSNVIDSLEAFLEIESSTDPTAKKAHYVLTTDLDLSSVTTSAVISGTFEGVIDGGGHTITGLTQPLISILSGSVSNLNFKDVNIVRNQAYLGTLAGETTSGAVIENITLTNAVVRGAGYDYIGGLVGCLRTSTVSNIRIDGIETIGKLNVGGLIGRQDYSTITNVEVINVDAECTGFYGAAVIGRMVGGSLIDAYTDGQLTIYMTNCGTVTGASRESSTIKNIVANVTVLRPQNNDSRSANGGVVGGYETDNGIIQNVAQIQNVADDVHKIISTDNTGLDKCMNIFELSDKTGIESDSEFGTVTVITSSDLTAEFYENTLGLDSSIWDFSNVAIDGYPRLK